MISGLLKQAGRVAFASFTWGSGLGVMMFNASAAVAMSPFLSSQRSQYLLLQPGMGLCVRLAGAKLRTIRHPDFDPTRRSVFMQNHVSLLDGHLACATIPHQFCGIMNHWHFNVPGYGWIMKLAHGIPVYPRKSGRTAEMTEHARDRIRRGISILAFPEAHRTIDGNVGTFKRGVFFMARDAGIPIVPLAVRGIYNLNRKGTALFNPGQEVCVFIGPQFETAGLSDDELQKVSDDVRAMMIDWIENGRLPEGCPMNKKVVPLYPLATHYWKLTRGPGEETIDLPPDTGQMVQGN